MVITKTDKKNWRDHLMTNNICTLKFYITDVNILDMVVDFNKKFAKATFISHEKSASPIMPQKYRHYAGLEQRLQMFMQSKKPLPDLIKEIELNGIHVDFHTNLNIDVVY